MKNKLIVLRGPSGSGKSTVAKAIHKELRDRGNLVAYIEQDYFRRIILKEKDISDGFNIKFIKDTVNYFLEKNYDVILEGIFDKGRYENMFKEIISLYPSNNLFFYFDISLKETLRRHTTKLNKDDFSVAEIRKWHRDKDFLQCIKEKVIPENNTIKDTTSLILNYYK